jgi:hypothetical protein
MLKEESDQITLTAYGHKEADHIRPYHTRPENYTADQSRPISGTPAA